MSTKNSIAYSKAYQFAIRVVKAYKHLTEQQKEYVLSKQLLRSGTFSVISDQSVVINQTHLRMTADCCLITVKDTEYITPKAFDSIFSDVDEIGKILYSIIKNLSAN